MKRKIGKWIVMVMVMLSIGAFSIIAYADSPEIRSANGTSDGYTYVLNLAGTSSSASAATYYAKSSTSRSVDLYAAYIGSSFSGIRTLHAKKSGTSGTVSTTININGLAGTNEIIAAYSEHAWNGYSKKLVISAMD